MFEPLGKILSISFCHQQAQVEKVIKEDLTGWADYAKKRDFIPIREKTFP